MYILDIVVCAFYDAVLARPSHNLYGPWNGLALGTDTQHEQLIGVVVIRQQSNEVETKNALLK